MRIWQNFRERRTALATASAIILLMFGVLEIRELFVDATSGVPSSDPTLAGALVVALVALLGGVLTLRRGNLMFLLFAWTFVLGEKLMEFVAFANEFASAAARENAAIGVVVANFGLLLVAVGALLGFVASTSRRRAQK